MANTRRVNHIITTLSGRFMVHTREGAADRRNGIMIASLEDPTRLPKSSKVWPRTGRMVHAEDSGDTETGERTSTSTPTTTWRARAR